MQYIHALKLLRSISLHWAICSIWDLRDLSTRNNSNPDVICDNAITVIYSNIAVTLMIVILRDHFICRDVILLVILAKQSLYSNNYNSQLSSDKWWPKGYLAITQLLLSDHKIIVCHCHSVCRYNTMSNNSKICIYSCLQAVPQQKEL